MGHVCADHAGRINPDYGSCAPLHFQRNMQADQLRMLAGSAERMAAALLAYAKAHRTAAELSDAAQETSDQAEAQYLRLNSRASAADGRAALHSYQELAALRDKIVPA